MGDIAAVTIFSLAIFYWAVSLTFTSEQTAEAITRDAQQLDYDARERWGLVAFFAGRIS